MPRGSFRLKQDAAKAAAMLQADPPAGRRISAEVVAQELLRALSCEIPSDQKLQKTNYHTVFFADLVALARGPVPDPIPNSTVKSLCANGTKSQDLGE